MAYIRDVLQDRAALNTEADPAPVTEPFRMLPRTAQRGNLIAKAVRVVSIPPSMTPAPVVELGVVQRTGGLPTEAGRDGAIAMLRTATMAYVLSISLPARRRADVVNEMAALNCACCGA